MNITELSLLSRYQAKVLLIAFQLKEVDDYTKDEAVTDLIKLASEINENLSF